LYIEVLEKRRELLGENHPDTLRTTGNLVSQYHAVGQVKRAQKLYIELLGRGRAVLGEDHPDTLRTMSCLASTYHDIGALIKGKMLNITVLERQIGVGGHQLRTLTNQMQNWFEKAEQLYVATLERQQAILGDTHRETVWTMHNLVLTYHNLGKGQEVEKLEALLRHSI
jgi:hypothetical protein